MLCPLCLQTCVEDEASMFCRGCEDKRKQIEAAKAAQAYQGISLNVREVRELTRRHCPWKPDF
ncbi:MAG: hypothetical protein RDU24_08920 [Humidesulfovibrio sp.]|uniref:hypothetical protein n=1 Tax=Humidesulfovibrio sp. TaxID=2910988 RepID=UPI0027E7FBB4|nr:hypothetical protein [Humidesulfovibrio sp.]MDQ7835490.1 hypothetical protein [Humidesulfovibrio sp.]